MTTGHGEKKGRQQETAIIALLTEPTMKLAAKKVGIGTATLWRWTQEDDFKELYRAAKKQAMSQAIGNLQQSCGEAVETLRTIMNDEASPAPSRVTAAKTILEMSMKAIETEDIEGRLEELERLQKANQPKGR
jgi:hypothetical protein